MIDIGRRDLAKKIFSLTVAVLGIYYVVSRLSFERTVSVLESSNPFFLFASFGVLGLIYVIMGERWRQILLENGVRISKFKGFVQLVVSDFVNTFAPARAGDIYRGLIASNEDKNSLETSIMVLTERVLDVSAISILLIFALISFLPEGELLLYPGFMLLIVFTGFLGFQLIRKFEELPIDLLNKAYTPFRSAAVKNFGSERWIALFLITVLIWIVGIGRTYLIFEAINQSIGFGAVTIITLSWAILAALPLSPSGIGTTDAAVFFILAKFGFEADVAGAFIILNRVILQGFPLTVGSLMYLKADTKS